MTTDEVSRQCSCMLISSRQCQGTLHGSKTTYTMSTHKLMSILTPTLTSKPVRFRRPLTRLFQPKPAADSYQNRPEKVQWFVGRGGVRVGASAHRVAVVTRIFRTVLLQRILPLPPGKNKLVCRGATHAKGNRLLAGQHIGNCFSNFLLKRHVYRVTPRNCSTINAFHFQR